jgi:hypothetical protein
VRVVAAAVFVAACGAPSAKIVRAPVASHADRDVAIVMYRDGALVRDRRWVDVPAGGATVDVELPEDVKPEDVIVSAGEGAQVPEVAHGGADVAIGTDARATIGSLNVSGAVRAVSGVWVIDDGTQLHLIDPPAISFARASAGAHVRAHVETARPGRYPVDVVYVTQAMAWRATYTLVGGGSRGLLHGSLTLDNRAGVALGPSEITLIDDTLGDGAGAVAQAIARSEADQTSVTPIAEPIDVGVGEIAVDLVGGERPVAVTSVLVYDPIGTQFDTSGHVPIQAESYGLGKPTTAVAESAEIDLGAGAGALPAGTVRLVERASDGTLTLRGQGALRGSVGAATTIAIGRAPDVTGSRERTELTIDPRAKRLVEEFELSFDNRGASDANVLVREHLYRGLSWALSYESTGDPTKEGPQQIAMRTTVPAHGHAKVVYVVVYTW